MHPSHVGQMGVSPDVRDNSRRSVLSQDTSILPRSTSSARRIRTEDSWIEIASQPSSSSLSSAGESDVITTGLNIEPRVLENLPPQLRLRTRSQSNTSITNRPMSAGGSSQDEYEESESESDRVLGSSNEDITNLVGEEEDDDTTALGTETGSRTAFTPQPNAFSHPPALRAGQDPSNTTNVPGSYFPELLTTARTYRASTSSRERLLTRRSNANQQHSSLPQSLSNNTHATRDPVYRQHTSSSQPDHDAALRASLTTLLSCAAAVRGSPPKERDSNIATSSNGRRQSHAEPRSLRLVPESQLMDNDEGERPVESSPPPPKRSTKRTHSPSTVAPAATSPSKQSAAAAMVKRKARESSKERHSSKKLRNAVSKPGNNNTTTSTSPEDEMVIHSTLLSWMISAGVVLVFSAISFSAGYAWGKEVGRLEGAEIVGAGGNLGNSCSQEVLRGGGLRRLRWGAGAASASVRA